MVGAEVMVPNLSLSQPLVSAHLGYDGEALLNKMVIVRKRGGNAALAHDFKAGTVHQTEISHGGCE